jgi:flagellar hook assembly protein FlgD
MLSLSEPYPNPFNPRTTIQFEIAQTTTLHLAIYDLSGRRLRTLLEAQILEAGGHEIVWDGCDDSGASMSSGVYLCRISGNNNSETRAVVLLK